MSSKRPITSWLKLYAVQEFVEKPDVDDLGGETLIIYLACSPEDAIRLYEQNYKQVSGASRVRDIGPYFVVSEVTLAVYERKNSYEQVPPAQPVVAKSPESLFPKVRGPRLERNRRWGS